MIRKKIAVAILSISMVFTMGSFASIYAEESMELDDYSIQEVETTTLQGLGTIDDPWKIETDTVITGTTAHGTAEPSEWDDYYFCFDVGDKGCMKPYASVVNPYHTTWNSLMIYSEEVKDSNLLFENSNFADSFEDIGETGIVSGKYIAKFSMRNCVSYKLKISFEKNDRYEEEIDSQIRPKKIKTDREFYYGETTHDYDAHDYYYFELDKKSKLTIFFKADDGFLYNSFRIYKDNTFSDDSLVLNMREIDFGCDFTETDIYEAGTYYIDLCGSRLDHIGYKFSIGSGEQDPEVSENKARKYSEETRGDFNISYCHEIPFYGKVKPSAKLFGDISVSYNNITYKVSKAKINKKKHLIQITGLEGADKSIVKLIKKATKGSNGLPFTVNPYYVRDTDSVTPKFKTDGTPKSVKIKIMEKYYKAKKNEWEYDSSGKIFSFKGDNLSGSYRVS